jgi:hypothetical protein
MRVQPPAAWRRGSLIVSEYGGVSGIYLHY